MRIRLAIFVFIFLSTCIVVTYSAPETLRNQQAVSASSTAASGKHKKHKEKLYTVGDKKVVAPALIYQAPPSEKKRELIAKQNNKYQSTILVSFIVDSHGDVHDVKVLTHGTPDIDKNAIAAVSTWKFRPAMYNGLAGGYRMMAEIKYKLKDQSKTSQQK